MKPVRPKGNHPWIFTGRTDAEAETPILWPPDAKGWLTGKDPDAGKDWGPSWEERGDRGWEHHWLNGHECEPTLGDGKGQESLVCCISWDRKELDTTERLNKRLFRKLHLFLAPHIASSVLISTVNQLLRCWMVATTRESTVGLWVKHPSAETSGSAHSQFNATFWYLHLCSLCGIQRV